MNLSQQSKEWYEWFLRRLVGSKQPMPMAYGLSINRHASLTQEAMLALLTRVSPAESQLLPLMITEKRIASFHDVLSCITIGGELCPKRSRQDHIQVCRIGAHWAVVLVIRQQGLLCVYVYHPGQYCRKRTLTAPWGDVHLCIRGAHYQTDQDDDSCATFAVWGSMYIPMFLKQHMRVPCHIPWFAKQTDAKEVDAACSEFLWGAHGM